jgi:hypothetical protein
MIMVWMSRGEQSPAPQKEHTPMHDLLIGLTFVIMVISPAVVAAFSGSSEVNAEN